MCTAAYPRYPHEVIRQWQIHADHTRDAPRRDASLCSVFSSSLVSWRLATHPSRSSRQVIAASAPDACRKRPKSAGWPSRLRASRQTATLSQGSSPVRSTGVSTAPVRQAAEAFLATLTPEQRAKTMFAVDDPEWRKWMNQHFYIRQGTGFKEMTEAQREAAFGLLRASLSAKGLQQSRDIMRLNHTLGELNNNNFEEYGEWLYWITVMGTPSEKEPWGWQLDGHHLIINYFVLGDQVVMTPTFMGSEPVTATSGKYKGTTVLQDEQNKGLALINALDDAQRQKAIIAGLQDRQQ